MFDKQVENLFRYLGMDVNAGYDTSPISLREIVERFSVKLHFMEMDDKTSGMYIRSNKGHYIFINENHHYNRQRFSLGHEFGHYYLGHPSDISLMDKEDRERAIEVEANKFSACLLMPPMLMYELHKTKSVTQMAEWLRVSPISAAIRCRELGLCTDEAECVISEYWHYQGDSVNKEEAALVGG